VSVGFSIGRLACREFTNEVTIEVEYFLVGTRTVLALKIRGPLAQSRLASRKVDERREDE